MLQFDVTNRREAETFDDLGSTKLSKRANRSRFGGLGVEFGGIWGGFAGMDDDDDVRAARPRSVDLWITRPTSSRAIPS